MKYLKRAQQLDPGDAGIGRAVRWYEEVEKVDLLNPSPPLSRPDMFFAAAVFLAAAAGAAFFVQKRRTSAGFAVLALCFAGLCLFSIQRSSRADAVVKEGGSLKRIPAEDSRVVREIETGTVVDITARTGIYRLIETGEKDEGWMEVTYLMEM